MLKKVALNICTKLARYLILFLEMNKLLCVSSWNFPMQYSTGLEGEYPSAVLCPGHFKVKHAEPSLTKWIRHRSPYSGSGS